MLLLIELLATGLLRSNGNLFGFRIRIQIHLLVGNLAEKTLALPFVNTVQAPRETGLARP